MVDQETTAISSETVISADVSAQSNTDEAQIPKIRKPYTITKQRERWSEEEHNKFLEALKLHGRAWRKIEEHLGTKTAVQIRSHAQKFFSKVVRETNNSNASPTEPIEIPPPRPKRKPSHPYPRKLVLPAKKDGPVEQLARSVSLDSSIYEQQNQSPTSVLSGLASDALACEDSATANRSQSPISSADDVDQIELVPSDDDTPQDDVPASPSVPDDQLSVKLELFPSVETSDKPELVAPKVLKLFGKDVVVQSDPSDASSCLSKSPSADMGEVVLQATQETFQPTGFALNTADNSWDCQTLYYVDGNGNHVEKPVPLPWWVFFRGIPVPPFECQVENSQEKENQREGSCAGSSSESVCDEKPALVEKTSNLSKASKGFVPYKRCFSDRETHSSTVSNNDEEGRRIRLCL